MKIFKKAVSFAAAAAVVTSAAAVTASAEYQLSGMNSGDKYYLRITGLPQEVFSDPNSPVIMLEVHFENDGEEYDKMVVINYYRKVGETECYIMDKSHNKCGEPECNALEFSNGEIGFMVDFKSDNEYLADFMMYGTGVVWFSGGFMDEDGKMKIKCYASNGDIVEQSYVERVAINWQAIPSKTDSEPAEDISEPEPSESVSEPEVSDQVNEPSETVIPEVSEVVSQPSNVDTGAVGIAAVIGTAVLAAGAVVVTRKRH